MIAVQIALDDGQILVEEMEVNQVPAKNDFILLEDKPYLVQKITWQIKYSKASRLAEYQVNAAFLQVRSVEYDAGIK